MTAGNADYALPAVSSAPQTDTTEETISDALREALGYVISEQRREWRREYDLITSQSREVISALKAANLELVSEIKAMHATFAMKLENEVSQRLAELQNGKDGRDGQDGKDGPQGPPGEKGDQGEVGAQGEQGAQGESGPRGAQGEAGETIIGPAGPLGPQGEKGEKGLDGAPGPAGAVGPAGAIGPAGQAGAIGPAGPIGATGESGESIVGPIGPAGPAGKDGAPGLKGDTGPQGLPGKLSQVKAWTDRVHYEGDIVVHKGGTYQANRDTAREPCVSADQTMADWSCLAAPGVDGKDGVDGRSLNVRGTYDASETYSALDIVTLNSSWFVARHDNPGTCPGSGWKSGPVGKTGKPGERGPAGPKGEQGPPGREVVGWQIDRRNFVVTPVMSDGEHGAQLSVRELFEVFDSLRGT